MAINYLHSNDIVHRDIKPENILIDNIDNMEIKLTDFGFATFHQSKSLDDVLGSPIYMPPEIIREERYGNKVDVWSAGVVAYVLITGKPPFVGKDKADVYREIKTKELDYSIPEFKYISENCIDFLKNTLLKNPDMRISAQEALAHPWLASEVHNLDPS